VHLTAQSFHAIVQLIDLPARLVILAWHGLQLLNLLLDLR
jgi:hypothetical protein